MKFLNWLKKIAIKLYAKTVTVNPKKVKDVETFLKATPFSIAKEELGVKEIVGRKHNPRIIEYHKTSGGFGSDEVSWCSSFVNWCFMQARLASTKNGGPVFNGQRTGKANARSWLKVGKSVDNPEVSDVVIFWRGKKNGWKGHVGFYAGEKGNKILVLGGNQANQVSYQYYPKSRLLGYRRF